MTSHTHHIAFKLALLAGLLVSSLAFAEEQTYVRDYTYQASEADSKISARAIALQEVKRELLNELGTHITALVKIQSASDGTQLGKEEIETLSAGVTSVEILDEKWNGVVYVLKAQIKADPEEVLKNLHKMLDADKKQKQISQLGGELSKVQAEKIQIAELLTQSKKETDAALAELARLKKHLAETQTDTLRQTLQAEYKEQVNLLVLSELFDKGLNFYTEGNFRTALPLLKKAAEQGHAVAQFTLGLMYDNANGVARDLEQSVYWFQQAAERGVVPAQYSLGLKYVKGDGVAHDAKQAVYWFQQAAERGFALAQYSLGVRYFKGDGVVRDAKQAVYWYRQAAAQGVEDAQFGLGLMYANGDGVVRDSKQAVYWFQKAAAQGFAPAQFNLGVIYANGYGVARDLKQAVYWYQQAATQGFADAQLNLGLVYAQGEGVARDSKQAAYWFQQAAEQGNVHAQYVLGLKYAKGDGVARDLKQAAYWWQKAANQGEANSQYMIGMMYGIGTDVAYDEKLAVFWLQKAAEQGHEEAQTALRQLQ